MKDEAGVGALPETTPEKILAHAGNTEKAKLFDSIANLEYVEVLSAGQVLVTAMNRSWK